ncbi:MAG: sugar-transfer associated ATP-grasp domain-containing protein [Parahaliea sp.]
MIDKIVGVIRRASDHHRLHRGLPVWRQLLEMLYLKLFYRLGPGSYFRFRLWRADLSLAEKTQYWHEKRYYRFVNSVNPLRYRIIARSKVVAKALLKFYGVRNTRYIGLLYPGGTYFRPDGGSTTVQGLAEELLRNSDLATVCLKPVEGSGGEGFRVLDIQRQHGLQLTQRGDTSGSFGIDKLCERLDEPDGYIVEQYLEQHPVLAAFNPSSLNTLRVWLVIDKSGAPSIRGVFLRVGRAGALVDNTSSGGLCVAMDGASFVTLQGIALDGKGGTFTEHPDSGAALCGVQIPFREETIVLCHEVIRALSANHFVGLDIGITTTGPVVVEFNLAPSPEGAGVIGRGHGELLEDVMCSRWG